MLLFLKTLLPCKFVLPTPTVLFTTLLSPQGSTYEHSLNNPSSLAIDAQDRVYVADTDNHRIAVFNHEGCYLKSIGRKGEKLKEFNEPCSLALSEGVLAVLERGLVL